MQSRVIQSHLAQKTEVINRTNLVSRFQRGTRLRPKITDGMALVGDVSITTSSKLVNNLIPGDTDTANDSKHPANSKEGGEQEKEELTQELEALRTEVTKLRRENADLLGLRKKVDGEIDELTAALFEEAYKMVNGAHERRAKVEKKLEESQGVVAGLEAESKALKALLELGGKLPSQPPKLGNKKTSISSLSGRRGSKASNGVVHKEDVCVIDGPIEETPWQPGEINSNEMRLLCTWLPTKTLSREDPYVGLIYCTDVRPCLSFNNDELSQRIMTAIEEFTLFMESVPNQTENTSSQCSLTYSPGKCAYRLKLTESGSWYYINGSCRDRIASVCDLYMFLRHIQQGLVKNDEKCIYWEIARLRAKISLARLHLKTL